jgi:hypothetical protein
VCLVALLVVATIGAPTAGAQVLGGASEYRGDNVWYRGVSTAERADVSPPLRDIPAKTEGKGKAERDDPDSELMTACGPLEKFDPVAQTWKGEVPNAMPPTDASFNAFANLCGGCSPPDPNAAVGPTQVVVMANVSLAVYDKTGAVLLTPRDINTIWTGFGGNCETENAGDPVVLYDRSADRWLISQFTAAGPTYYNCVALSTTGDATGSWQRYAFSNGTSFPDYPKYGIWRDAYYFTTRNTSGTTGQGAYALNRSEMLAGSLTPQVVSFLLAPGSTAYYGGDGLLPADIDGATLPPVGAPELFIGSMDNGGPYSAPQDALYIYQFHVDWVTPANSTFTRLATVPVAAFDSTFTPCAGGRTCIPQPDTTNKLDILSYRQRLLHRAAYRNFGDHESIVANQSVAGTATIAGVRWYEIRDPNGTPTIYQQGTYVPGATDSVHRWMGSIAMDRIGNMALGFSASAATGTYPSIWYTGRYASDPLGTMPLGEGSVVNGAGSQTSSNRWGDYTSMSVDPADDCTFWYANQYFTASSASTWQVRVGSFHYPSCLCAVTPAAPDGISAMASAPNVITLSWNDAAAASITRYFVYRSLGPTGPFSKVATVADTSPGLGGGAPYSWDDATVSGGSVYHYYVRADDGATCTSPSSAEASAVATGVCLLAPTFAGVASVASPGASTCTIGLSWSAASSNCSGGSVTYSVYRSTASGFTPGPANVIASGLAGTTFSDLDNLVFGTRYYYVVRATDSVSGSSDSNTTEKSALAVGPSSPGTWTNGAESGDPAMTAGTPWATSTTYKRSGANSWFSGYTTSTCAPLTTPSLVLGTGSVLSWYGLWSMESGWDGARVEISSDSGSTWTALTPTPAYPSTITNSGNACTFATTTPVYNGNSTGYPTTWQAAQVNLFPTYNGKTVLVRWRFSTDGSGSGSLSNPGWYVDDIQVTDTLVPGSCATGSACPNNPTVVDVTPNGPLTICAGTSQTLSAGLSGGGGPFTYQWFRDGVEVSGANDPTFSPNETGSHTYNCKVSGNACATGLSDAASVQIAWQGAPSFAGLSSVTNSALATCQLVLAWTAGSTPCSGPVAYNVYRSTTTPVNPIPANRVAFGLSGTSWSDTGGLASGTTYYYLVRAFDASSGQEETNVVERSGIPTGPGSFTTLTDTFEGSLSGGGFDLAGWTHLPVAGSVDFVWSTAQSQSATHSWFSASQGSISDRVLVSPSFLVNGGGTPTTLSFYHTYKFEGTSTCFDGGTLEISTDGGSTWAVVPDAAFTAGLFTGTVSTSYSNPIGGKRAWCFGTVGAMTQVQVNLSSYAGLTAKIRWHEGDDSSSVGTGWYVDQVVIANTGSSTACTTASSAPKPAPDGKWIAGTPLKGAPNASAFDNVDVTWGVGTGCTSDDYNVYWGSMSSFSAFSGGSCDVGNSGVKTNLVIPDDSWWVVAGTDGNDVSLFRRDSTGAEPTLTGWGAGGVCPTQTTKNTGGSCP